MHSPGGGEAFRVGTPKTQNGRVASPSKKRLTGAIFYSLGFFTDRYVLQQVTGVQQESFFSVLMFLSKKIGVSK